ncbi:phosphate acyltransferase PlsX [Histidinibacterium lentulum]|uniref:Phosphate acyltransferase n=1 Tax=Histidinibacterium lentulum TaxID=2480588 RepID=A0A3N2QYL5_9RHOB|nr:phosphate acyltransferase PlsX [Histidinibacterium lentulum]ROU00196.1 phosphate acyltransferase PlsX [Histidinibacterium lentulum]
MTLPAPTAPSRDAVEPAASPKDVVISVDAMGGDSGPATVVAGLAEFLDKTPGARIVLHGRASELAPLIARRRIGDRVELMDAADVVAMSDKPSHVMRHGKDTSMWSAIETVREGRAQVCVSCGNTGALMAVAMIRLRKAEGVNRPAIACLWPSRNPTGFNVMLDVGADIRADEDDLLTFALMGASYARNGLGLERPRIGLLNVGVEDHKGRAELKVAGDLIARAAPLAEFDYVGFVEGGDIPSDRVDVIVTDGFTGNIALKTGEGTASLISEFLREAFRKTPLSRIAALLAMTSLTRLKKRIDPRRVNGGVFLGLNGTVVKSHGSADATGVAAALNLAYRLAKTGFSDKLAARVAAVGTLGHDSTETREAAVSGDVTG